MKNTECDACGNLFHACSSCGFTSDWEWSFCSMDCAFDDIFRRTDAHFHRGRFKEVDDELRGIDFDETPTDILIAWLVATLPAKSKLPYREEFRAKVADIVLDASELDGL